MNANNTDETTHADTLREAMISKLREMGAIRSDRVADAFRAVPRHSFAPGASLEPVYSATDSVVIKRDEHNIPISTVSAPELQAFMLEQADPRPGMNALEIGSGGVNAAMMAWLVGSEGTVTTVDIDPEVTERASSLLDAAGYSRVNVVLADAENGVPEHAPYDRIIVAVGAWDVPPAWLEQLADSGRIVVPLRMRGLTRSLALDRDAGHLVSRSAMTAASSRCRGPGPIRSGWCPFGARRSGCGSTTEDRTIWIERCATRRCRWPPHPTTRPRCAPIQAAIASPTIWPAPRPSARYL
jgi:protein-L-isoaspartate(D-aspartate) O-methyltransferase